MNVVERFRELHAAGCFVMPNPWDAGSAVLLQHLGFSAVATTSAGFAWTLARQDNHVTLDEALVHFRTISSAVNVPVNADFEHGFAEQPSDIERNYSAVATTGIAGVSIEDSTGNVEDPIFAFDLAVERVRAARRGIDSTGTGVLLTARHEGYLVDRADIGETIRRLTAYADAGADCLYAPGVTNVNEIRQIVDAVAPKPVNVLVWKDFTTVAEVAALGARRISVGAALARAAWTGFFNAAREIKDRGTFTTLGAAVVSSELNGVFETGGKHS